MERENGKENVSVFLCIATKCTCALIFMNITGSPLYFIVKLIVFMQHRMFHEWDVNVFSFRWCHNRQNRERILSMYIQSTKSMNMSSSSSDYITNINILQINNYEQNPRIPIIRLQYGISFMFFTLPSSSIASLVFSTSICTFLHIHFVRHCLSKNIMETIVEQ